MHEAQRAAYPVYPLCPPVVQKGHCHVNLIRKMPCSFSWDWAPSFPSTGVWKPIWLEGSNGVVIRDVLVETIPHKDFDTATAFAFVVNDVPVYAKGSNWVPPDIFPERITNSYVRELLLSVKEANMNMLRVWGGGVYETDYFYSFADELGILIWQDMMFSASLYPADRSFLQSVTTEVQQQVRRLQYHPSVVIWAGNNENEDALASGWWKVQKDYDLYRTEYLKLYIGVIKTVVETEDKTRPFVSSTPSNGRKTAEDGWISSSPNAEMNGDGAHFAARIINAYFRTNNASWNGRLADYDMVSYLTQVVQAEAVRTGCERFRRLRGHLYDGLGHNMGVLFWQLNDIWPAPSWASIEYGGRWKMLHYFARKFFSPIIVSPYLERDEEFRVFIVNDLLTPVEGAMLDVTLYSSLSFTPLWGFQLQPKVRSALSADLGSYPVSDQLRRHSCSRFLLCFFWFVLRDQTTGKLLAPEAYLLPGDFKETHLHATTIKVTSVVGPTAAPREPGFSTFDVTLRASSIALFVWLTARHLSGRFSDNGFLLKNPTIVVQFSTRENVTAEALEKAIIIETLSNYVRTID
ncbi:beta-mannosidase-like [Dermacentor silvarum]|uniref:beta-mannosidase-like n=1 Tax=Dermacentor silvarum TaxID=543639 RepID=UPI002100B62E|nr:beta-mannosidase-like [Dermacentor silvarum]